MIMVEETPGDGSASARGWAGLSSAGMGVTLIVDGANVMGSRADGWWRDRAGAMARLHGELAALAARGIPGPVPGASAGPVAGASAGPVGDESAGPAGDDGAGPVGDDGAGPAPGDAAGDERWFPQVVLVVEGRARAVLGLVSDAPGVRVVAARGEGDDEIAGLAGELSGRRIVVTADRELRRRSAAAGAVVMGPRWLTSLLA